MSGWGVGGGMENRGTIDRQEIMQTSMCNKTARGHDTYIETAAEGYSSLHFISSHFVLLSVFFRS